MANRDLYVVTGGAGFIGSHIAETLLRARRRVRVFDSLDTGRRENLRLLRREGGRRLQVVAGDLRDLPSVRRGLRGARFVLHQGALPSVTRSVRDPLATHQVNVNGTLNVLLAARDEGVDRVVFASSSSVYGDSPRLPKVETQPPAPLSPYAVSKLAGEQYCALFGSLYGLRTVCLRYFNVFGPRQDPRSEYAAVIPRFVTALLRGRRPVIFGDGLQSRDFTFVANVVRANLIACRAPVRACGRAYNVAGGQRVTLRHLLRLLGRIIGMDPRPVFEAPRPADVRHSLASVTRARRLLGYRPRVGLEEGLRRTVRAFQAEMGGRR
jgi:UDP-glucose 4-epimerase